MRTIKRIMRLGLTVFLFGLVGSSTATATDFSSATEWTLVGESYENAALIRHYQDENKQDIVYFFDVPEHLRDYVNASHDPALEAKKRLTTYYTLLEDQEMLASIANKAVPETEATLSLTDTYANNFNEDMHHINEFVASELQKEDAYSVYEVTDAKEVPPPSEEETPTKEASKSWGMVGVVGGLIVFIFAIVLVIVKRR